MKLKELILTYNDTDFVSALTPSMRAPEGTTFNQFVYNHFMDYETITDDRDTFLLKLSNVHKITSARWGKLIDKYQDMINELIEAEDERTVTAYASPNGNPDTAYSTGMTREVFKDTTTEDDFARLTRVNEIRNFYYDLLKGYECLFVGAWAI